MNVARKLKTHWAKYMCYMLELERESKGGSRHEYKNTLEITLSL